MAGDDFLSRWSRRKREVVQVDEPSPLAGPSPQPDETAQPGAAIDDAYGADTIADEDIAALPSLDSLTAETDLTQFLRIGVPQAIRNAALRRMWSIDPGIRDYLSEAREYAFDWHIPGAVPGTGPMLPTDDIAGMVRDVFAGSKPVVVEPPPSEQIDEDEHAEAVSAITADHDQGVRTQIAAISEPTSLSTENDPMPGPQAEAQPVGRIAETGPVGRLRRHGGASPI